MLIKSFKAPTLKEAMANVKAELGVDAVILHTSKTKKGGILGFHSKEVVEVIAAVEEESPKPPPADRTVLANDAVLQAAEAARSSRAAARAGRQEQQAFSDGAEEQTPPISAALANFTPRTAVSQYRTAGTQEAVSQAMSRNSMGQTFSEVLASVNQAQELSEAAQAAPEKAERQTADSADSAGNDMPPQGEEGPDEGGDGSSGKKDGNFLAAAAEGTAGSSAGVEGETGGAVDTDANSASDDNAAVDTDGSADNKTGAGADDDNDDDESPAGDNAAVGADDTADKSHADDNSGADADGAARESGDAAVMKPEDEDDAAVGGKEDNIIAADVKDSGDSTAAGAGNDSGGAAAFNAGEGDAAADSDNDEEEGAAVADNNTADNNASDNNGGGSDGGDSNVPAAVSGEAVREYSEQNRVKDEQINDLQNQLEEMKSMLMEMSKSKDRSDAVPTLQGAMQAQEVTEKILQDMITKLNGTEILSPKNSFRAVDALERYIRKAVRVANGITLYSDKPKVAALIGPTGVGKTTTLAKIAARFVLEQGARVALITADTYRISAVEQLKTYSDILGLPLEIVYNPDALKKAIEKHKDKQLILIDTAGRSQYNEYQMKELGGLLSIDADIEKHLVMSATTKTSDGIELLERFSICRPDRVIFSKVDETGTHGIILNILHRRKVALSYITNGQSVPDDIEPASIERLAELLLR